MADLHKAIIALYSNVATVNGNTESDIVAKDINGNTIDIDWTQVNAWTDPEAYKYQREAEYPPLAEQLDYIYHNGVDAWKADMILPIKNKYPKE